MDDVTGTCFFLFCTTWRAVLKMVARLFRVKQVKTTKQNRPFPSSKKSHFQNEAKCETFVVKMSFICIIIKTHFHINGFALSLALKVRFYGTRKWPNSRSCFQVSRTEKTGRKEFLTALKCLNWKKSSQQLPSCVIATRDLQFCKMFSLLFCFEQVKALNYCLQVR